MLQTAIDQATYKTSGNPAAQAIPTLAPSCGMKVGAPEVISSIK